MHRQYLNPARLVMLEKTIETVTENGQKTIVVPVTPPSITENTASMQHQISKSDFIVTEVETKERIIENYEIKTEPTIHPINICETEGCKSAIEQIHSFYDPTIDPCDDFYQFACGGYVNKTQIPADQVSVNVFSEILDILLVQLQTLISEPIRVDETKPFRLAKQLYSACLNESLLEERGTGPLLAIASRFGGWPVLFGEDQWVHEENWNWLQMNMDLRDGGFPFDTIFGLSVQTDLMNSSIRTLDVNVNHFSNGNINFISLRLDRSIQSRFESRISHSGLRQRTRSELFHVHGRRSGCLGCQSNEWGAAT